jgi:hypothetical protein
MNVSNRLTTILVFVSMALSLSACMDQYDPPAANDSASSVNVDTASHPLYRSFYLFQTTFNGQSGEAVDYLVTLDKNETLPSYTSLGAYMSVLVNPSPTRSQLFRCSQTTTNSGLVHYVSTDQFCEGGTVEGSLGYLEQNPVGNVVTPVHRCTGVAENLPGGGAGPFLSPYHNIITEDQTDCLTNSTLPSILGYTL